VAIVSSQGRAVPAGHPLREGDTAGRHVLGVAPGGAVVHPPGAVYSLMISVGLQSGPSGQGSIFMGLNRSIRSEVS